LRLRLDITVSEQGGMSSGGGSSGGAGDGIGVNPAGYPPRATYRFEAGPASGHVVLSTGPRTLYYSRSVSYQWQFGSSEAFTGGPSGSDRLTYVIAFTGQENSDVPRQLGARHASAPWRGADDLRRRVDALRADLLRAYQRFVTGLVAAGHLDAADAASVQQPRIAVEVLDARADRSVPLPVIK
jgi:hypothetical protein